MIGTIIPEDDNEVTIEIETFRDIGSEVIDFQAKDSFDGAVVGCYLSVSEAEKLVSYLNQAIEDIVAKQDGR